MAFCREKNQKLLFKVDSEMYYFFVLSHFTFSSSSGLDNRNETEMSSSLNQEHLETLKKKKK